jgi:hypothetical protein
MNRNIVRTALLMLMLIPGMGALAQGSLSQKITFQVDGRIGGETVRRGTCTLIIPDGTQGTLTVKSGKRSLTVPFTRQEVEEPAATDKVTYRENGDGSRSVSTIAPRGQKFVLTLGGQ